MYVGYLSIFRVPVLWKTGSCVLVLVGGDSLTSRTGCQLMACGCGCHYVDPCPAFNPSLATRGRIGRSAHSAQPLQPKTAPTEFLPLDVGDDGILQSPGTASSIPLSPCPSPDPHHPWVPVQQHYIPRVHQQSFLLPSHPNLTPPTHTSPTSSSTPLTTSHSPTQPPPVPYPPTAY